MRLFVSGIHWSVTEEILRKLFERYGVTVLSMTIKDGEHCKFAFVNIPAEDVAKAHTITGKYLGEMKLKVARAKAR